MNISIICPLYNAEKYICELHESLQMQENVKIESINYVLTESSDNTEKILKQISARYKTLKKDEFSHSLTREEAALDAEGDIIVFITQDIIIKDRLWLYKLTQDISKGKCEAAFSRQLCVGKGIESYIRTENYSDQSRIVSKEDIKRLGLMTFFFSDAASAVRKDIFIKLKGYDKKKLIINEDMYFAYKLIMSGYKIKYCSDSIVIHSHQFTCKQLFNRYFDTGVFLCENSYLLKYGTNKSGISLFKSILRASFKQKDFNTLVNIIPNFASRFLGMYLGKKYNKLPNKVVKKLSLSKNYWT